MNRMPQIGPGRLAGEPRESAPVCAYLACSALWQGFRAEDEASVLLCAGENPQRTCVDFSRG
jgi:hypothetical protein